MFINTLALLVYFCRWLLTRWAVQWPEPQGPDRALIYDNLYKRIHIEQSRKINTRAPQLHLSRWMLMCWPWSGQSPKILPEYWSTLTYTNIFTMSKINTRAPLLYWRRWLLLRWAVQWPKPQNPARALIYGDLYKRIHIAQSSKINTLFSKGNRHGFLYIHLFCYFYFSSFDQ